MKQEITKFVSERNGVWVVAVPGENKAGGSRSPRGVASSHADLQARAQAWAQAQVQVRARVQEPAWVELGAACFFSNKNLSPSNGDVSIV